MFAPLACLSRHPTNCAERNQYPSHSGTTPFWGRRIPQNAPTDPCQGWSSWAVFPTTPELPEDMQIAMSPARSNCSSETFFAGVQIRSFFRSRKSRMFPARRMGINPWPGEVRISALSKLTPRTNLHTSPSRTQRQPAGNGDVAAFPPEQPRAGGTASPPSAWHPPASRAIARSVAEDGDPPVVFPFAQPGAGGTASSPSAWHPPVSRAIA